MPKVNKRSREEADTYESDGGFVSNDDGNAPKKSKKSKTSDGSKGAAGGGIDKFWPVCMPCPPPFHTKTPI